MFAEIRKKRRKKITEDKVLSFEKVTVRTQRVEGKITDQVKIIQQKRK
jgi:hypothetical protein